MVGSAGITSGVAATYVRGETFSVAVTVSVEAPLHNNARLQFATATGGVTAVALVGLSSPDGVLSSCGPLSGQLSAYDGESRTLDLCNITVPGAGRGSPMTLVADLVATSDASVVVVGGDTLSARLVSHMGVIDGELPIAMEEPDLATTALANPARPSPFDAGSVVSYSTTVSLEAASVVPAFDVLFSDQLIMDGDAVLVSAAVNGVVLSLAHGTTQLALGDFSASTTVDVAYSLELTAEMPVGGDFRPQPALSWAALSSGVLGPFEASPLSAITTVDRVSASMSTNRWKPEVGLPPVSPGDEVIIYVEMDVPEGDMPASSLLVQQEAFAQLLDFQSVVLDGFSSGITLDPACNGSLVTQVDLTTQAFTLHFCNFTNTNTDDGTAETLKFNVSALVLTNAFVQPGSLVTPQTIFTPGEGGGNSVRQWHELLVFLVPADFVESGALDLGFTLDGVNTGETYNVTVTLCDPGTENFTAPTQDVEVHLVVPTGTVTLHNVDVQGANGANYTVLIQHRVPVANLSDEYLAGVFDEFVDVVHVTFPVLDPEVCTTVTTEAEVVEGTNPASVPHSVALEFYTAPPPTSLSNAHRPASSATLVQLVPVVCDASISCAGHGVCQDHADGASNAGECVCQAGWRGTSCCECDASAAVGDVCSGAGTCNADGSCACGAGFDSDPFCRSDSFCTANPAECGLPAVCVVDCAVSEWTEFGECSVGCGLGGGVVNRSRTVEQEPSFSGVQCPVLFEEAACNTGPCPVDCEVSPWSPFGACSALCGGGNQTRTRTVVVEPDFGGAVCPADLQESQACNTQRCLSAEEQAAAAIDEAIAFQACDRSDVKFAVSAALPLESTPEQRAASLAAPLCIALICALVGGVYVMRGFREKYRPSEWAVTGGVKGQSLYHNWRNHLALAILVLDAVLMSAPAFVPDIPWLSYFPVKAMSRLLSLAAVRVFETWLVLFAAFGAVLVFVVVMMRIHSATISAVTAEATEADAKRTSLVPSGTKSWTGKKPPRMVTLAGAREEALAATTIGGLEQDDDDIPELPLHMTTSVLTYVVGGVLVVPMLTVFLQTFTCGFPFGAYKRNAATQECTQVDCWTGVHLFLLVVAVLLSVMLAWVGALGLRQRSHQDEVLAPQLPASMQSMRTKALELQMPARPILWWLITRFGIVFAGVIGTRLNLAAGAIASALLATAAFGCACKWNMFVTHRHRLLPRLSTFFAALTCWLLVAIHFLVERVEVDPDAIAAGTASSLVVNDDKAYDGEPVVLAAAGVWAAAAVVCVVLFLRQQRKEYPGITFWHSSTERLTRKQSRIQPVEPEAGVDLQAERRRRVGALSKFGSGPTPLGASDFMDTLSPDRRLPSRSRQQPGRQPPGIIEPDASDSDSSEGALDLVDALVAGAARTSQVTRRHGMDRAQRNAMGSPKRSRMAFGSPTAASPRIASPRGDLVQTFDLSMREITEVSATASVRKTDGGGMRAPSPT